MGANVVYDPVGGSFSEPALRAIAWEGRFLVIGFAAGEIPKPPLNLALLKGCQIVGCILGGLGQECFLMKIRRIFKSSLNYMLQGKLTQKLPIDFHWRMQDKLSHILKDRKARGQGNY